MSQRYDAKQKSAMYVTNVCCMSLRYDANDKVKNIYVTKIGLCHEDKMYVKKDTMYVI